MSKLKILLAIEDYKDHNELSSLVSKAGWDLESVKREILIKDEMLAFNPDVLIVSGPGRQINGIRLAKTLYRKNGRPKMALFLNPAECSPESLKGVPVDAVLEKPFDAVRIVRALCRIAGIDDQTALERFRRASAETTPAAIQSEITHVHGERIQTEQQHLTGGASPKAPSGRRNWLSDDYRQKLYAEIIKSVDENALNEWDLDEVKKTAKALQEEHTPDLDRLDEQRQDFARALFKRD